ncbi:ribokinase [Aequitasia blattaphilus]|uniref:Ribokinase n=1 Tax=Aequitasia blattaphilus TaxID=2949332 RepID=A0ABT1E7X6_9FIRM|nr:PfkB family carbohydrate kinase [Aequitasia blattaphilus]MCP1101929.1 PfkB family carbohydrate kinase [Aequitasia blattaphilus]MCR8614569.1 PfkB family carbohydrate kinase [Aequitasia blattaphilus]
MTIKDIARLAGVSISTVSKVMNQKDESISEATREKVLQIIKEYNYAPRYNIASQSNTKTFTIGLILNSATNDSIVSGVINVAQKNGYSVMLYESSMDQTRELKAITSVCHHQVDGLLWEPISSESIQHTSLLKDNNIPYFILNAFFYEKSINQNFEKAGFLAAKTLFEYEHTDIAFLGKENFWETCFLDGYKSCLYEQQIPFDQANVFHHVDESLIQRITSRRISAIAVSNYDMALSLYEKLISLHLKTPDDVSIISLKEESLNHIHHPSITSLLIPNHAFGESICEKMIFHLETKKKPNLNFSKEFILDTGSTIGIPKELSPEKILVIGSVNIDYYMRVKELPKSGKSTIASSLYSYPGGKGINEAIGAAKLGARVALIGTVGNDPESEIILSSLNELSINSSGICRIPNAITGKAYIVLSDSGESTITILSGATDSLKRDSIQKLESLFENTAYCLLQTEVPMPVIESGAALAKKHGATTILKPAACNHLSDELLSTIDILIPNLDEASTLCPDSNTVEEKALYFLGKGVSTVIITLGSEGSYLRTQTDSMYFPAYDFKSIDNTGAADAFISAFAVYLQKGVSLPNAVKIASYAAGFCISREGVVPSLVDLNTLESYIKQNDPALLLEAD